MYVEGTTATKSPANFTFALTDTLYNGKGEGFPTKKVKDKSTNIFEFLLC